MVCNRCIDAVQASLSELEIPYLNIVLGEVETPEKLDQATLYKLSEKLESKGFAILETQKSQLISRIKNQIIDIVHRDGEWGAENLSHILAKKLLHEYTYLSNLFSSVEGITIEKYFIYQRIERAKELLFYDEKSLTEIADELGYSNVAHLSSQFKKITGMTPTGFKQVRTLARVPLDKVGKKKVNLVPSAVIKTNNKKKKK